jgi:DNA polymerase III sliding clamp (beta) subunit (PCNA family)
MLEGVYIYLDGGRAVLYCTDNEIAIEYAVDADVKEPGSAIVNAKLFGDIVRSLPLEEVRVSSARGDGRITLSSGKSVFDMLVIQADAFPAFPAIAGGSPYRIDQHVLRKMMSQTSFAVSSDETRKTLTGLFLESDGAEIRACAVDGFRIALRRQAVMPRGRQAGAAGGAAGAAPEAGGGEWREIGGDAGRWGRQGQDGGGYGESDGGAGGESGADVAGGDGGAEGENGADRVGGDSGAGEASGAYGAGGERAGGPAGARAEGGPAGGGGAGGANGAGVTSAPAGGGAAAMAAGGPAGSESWSEGNAAGAGFGGAGRMGAGGVAAGDAGFGARAAGRESAGGLAAAGAGALAGGSAEESAESLSLIVPARTVSELIRIIPPESGELALYGDRNQAIVAFGRCRVFTRIIDGEFFNYKYIIPEEYVTQVIVSRDELLGALESAAVIIAHEQIKRRPVVFSIAGDSVRVRAMGDIGVADVSVPADIQGEDMDVGFNPHFFMDALKAIEDETIAIRFTTKVGQCVVRPLNNDSYTYLILPVKIADPA